MWKQTVKAIGYYIRIKKTKKENSAERTVSRMGNKYLSSVDHVRRKTLKIKYISGWTVMIYWDLTGVLPAQLRQIRLTWKGAVTESPLSHKSGFQTAAERSCFTVASVYGLQDLEKGKLTFLPTVHFESRLNIRKDRFDSKNMDAIICFNFQEDILQKSRHVCNSSSPVLKFAFRSQSYYAEQGEVLARSKERKLFYPSSVGSDKKTALFTEIICGAQWVKIILPQYVNLNTSLPYTALTQLHF